jgi:hypothetical protein
LIILQPFVKMSNTSLASEGEEEEDNWDSNETFLSNVEDQKERRMRGILKMREVLTTRKMVKSSKSKLLRNQPKAIETATFSRTYIPWSLSTRTLRLRM